MIVKKQWKVVHFKNDEETINYGTFNVFGEAFKAEKQLRKKVDLSHKRAELRIIPIETEM